MMESKYELGVDLVPSDCNCREVTRAAVHTELSRILASRTQDMSYLLEKNMDAIMAAAMKGRE